MSQIPIIKLADELEENIHAFLKVNQDGGKFMLPTIKHFDHLVIPLMITTFKQEGWELEYDYDDSNEWFMIKKEADSFDDDYTPEESD